MEEKELKVLLFDEMGEEVQKGNENEDNFLKLMLLCCPCASLDLLNLYPSSIIKIEFLKETKTFKHFAKRRKLVFI